MRRCECVPEEGVIPKQQIVLTQDKQTIAADGADESVISGIPEGAVVAIFMSTAEMSSTVVTDGKIEISSDVPATYILMVSAQNMIAATATVTAQ